MFAARPLRAVSATRPLRGVAAVATVAFVLLPWLYALSELRHPEVVETVARPTAIVWGDRVFSSKAAFSAWLRSYGVSYESWARKHPDGLRTLDPKAYRKLTPAQRGIRTTRPSPTTPAPAPARARSAEKQARPPSAEAAHAVAQPETRVSPAPRVDGRATALMYALLVVVLLLLTFAFLPPRLVAAHAGPRLAAAQAYRIHLMVAASAISLGVFTSALLS
jgi:hypothetical protein